jgi:hypothetical protein
MATCFEKTTSTKTSPASLTVAGKTNQDAILRSKFNIGSPDDIFEKEADVAADKIINMQTPDPINFSHVQNLQRKCAHCEQEEKEKLQRKEISEEVNLDANISNYIDKLDGNGENLPDEVRNFYEPRFGYDFNNVQIHTNAVAAKSAQSMNALAYTTGNNIVFNEGQYSPNTDSGKKLLAHELTHVVQQNNSVQTKKIQRLADPNCSSASGVPHSSSCSGFVHTCYSGSFTSSSRSVTVDVNVGYSSDDCSYSGCTEDYRVIVYQCGWFDTEVQDLGTACVGSALSGSVTLPGSGWIVGNDNYYVKVYSRSHCRLDARINVS